MTGEGERTTREGGRTTQAGASRPGGSPSNDSVDFYARLVTVADFEELSDAGSYHRLPDDWWVVVSDIVGSTRAIAEGRYKEVNSVGVSVITAVKNASRPVDVPYVFGGDGATLCVPESRVSDARAALAATIAMADRAFDLELRGAVVPVGYVRGRRMDVLVARHRVSEYFHQCAFFGGGVTYLEDSLKADELPAAFLVKADAAAEASFEGLECRWDEVPSPASETVSLIIEAVGDRVPTLDTYRWVMERVRSIYGDPDRCRPVVTSGLNVTLSREKLARESNVKAWRAGPFGRMWANAKLRLFALIGRYLFWTEKKTAETDWGVYKADLVANTDFRKFDGTMRLVLTGDPEQRTVLQRFLDGLARADTVRYGIHVSDAAVVTCIVEKRQGHHFHFVDGAGGGYAAAAKDLKGRVAAAAMG